MKASLSASVLALAVIALGGCASMHDRDKPMVTQNPNQEVDDQAYIAQVEHIARSRGVAVRWVNPPTKKVKDLREQ